MGPLARTAPIIRSLSAVRGLARALAGVFVSGLLLAACSSDQQSATIAPTLNWRTIDGNRIAFQNGIPVPTFSYQPRLRLDVSGDWRLQTTTLNDQLSLMRRPDSLPRILQEAHGRQAIAFDDRSWPVTQVPGTYNPPPSPGPNGAWYRKAFDIPDSWGNHALTLKFGAVNYIADVWLNGQYLGYHEGGSTPFAFDATAAITPGATNLLAVRVDNPAWGTRQDIVPWGLTDWWNYGGLLQPVWLEATSSVYAVRADVVLEFVPGIDRERHDASGSDGGTDGAELQSAESVGGHAAFLFFLRRHALELDEFAPVESRLSTHNALAAHSVILVHGFGRADQHFLRVAAAQGARSAEWQVVDHRHAPARGTAAKRGDCSGRSGSDDDEIVLPGHG